MTKLQAEDIADAIERVALYTAYNTKDSLDIYRKEIEMAKALLAQHLEALNDN